MAAPELLRLVPDAPAELGEILDAWFAAGPSTDPGDVANVEHVDSITD